VVSTTRAALCPDGLRYATFEAGGAIVAWKRAAAPIRGLRFHDLRRQAITEMAEAGASDATLVAVAGHMSRRMLEHYSHVRMAGKRTAPERLESGLMGGTSQDSNL
jgi:integrase